MHVELLIGIPGSGKTTHAKKRAKQGYMIVDVDHLITMFRGGDHVYEEKIVSLCGTLTHIIAEEALYRGFNVVIDMTNWSKAHRRLAVMRFGEDHCISAVYWEPDIEACLSNRLLEPRNTSPYDWREVVKDYANKIEPVTEDEGFDYISIKKVIDVDQIKILEDETNLVNMGVNK